MEPMKRWGHEELPALTMENELLRYEVHHLRARLAEAEDRARAAADTAEDEKPATGSLSSRAEDDLVWLLQRLDRFPAGPVLRRRPGIQELRQRYLGEDGK
jgi:hypothetical protein